MLTVLTGRSRRLWPQVLSEIGQAYAAGAQRLFLITPDQYTLQAELDLVDRLNLPGLLEIEVLSPSRLLQRVFSLAGSPQRVRVDARGKAMMLADVLRREQDKLTYYAGAAQRRGFADRLAAAIGDFKRAGEIPAEVAERAMALAEGDALRDKLLDIAYLYGRYEARLEGAFIDGEDAQEALLERLPHSGLLSGAQIWVYGFDLITPQFARQLVVMARGAQSVRLALTWENALARDGLAFTPARDTLARLARLLDREQMLWEQQHIVANLPSTEAIRHLELELFAVGPVVYRGDPGSIHLCMASDPYDEAGRVAARMLAYARGGMRFDEMAVVLGNAEGYAGAIEAMFGRSGIPYHMIRQRPALAHPLLRAWLAGLRCATLGWRAEDALDWLKGGFCGLIVEEAERLENYAIAHGLRGSKWKKRIEDIELDALRARFVAPLEALQDSLRRARTNTASLTAAYQLLEDTDAYGTLEAWQNTLEARGMFTEAAECAQAWRLALETLDQLHALLHGSRMAMRGLAQVIESGLAAAELGAVPASPGMVQAGQLGHIKLGDSYRVVFLLGMQDGVMQTASTSLLTDAEVARATEASDSDAAFGLRGDALAQLMQINLLDTLAAPREALYISHAAVGPGGEAQRPAAVLKLLRRVFPDLEEEGSALGKEPVWHAPGAALDALGPMLRDVAAQGGTLDGVQADITAWLLHDPSTHGQADRILRALAEPLPQERLGGRAAGGLYAHTRTSVSRLEAFASCPFKHYVAYGLRPTPRQSFAVERSDTGTFYHRAMEGYTRQAAELPDWPQISREQSDAIMEDVLTPLRAEWEETPLGDNAMLRATGEVFCRIARRAAWTYAGQMQRSAFATGPIEVRFGPGEALPAIGLILPDGQRRWVEGRIDRIDFFEDDGEQWLRVVDYKSGGTSLDPSRVYGGLQLQLLMYLMAALAAFPGVAPAGAFYSRFDDPLVLTDSRDVEEIERLLAKSLRLRGIALSDVRVVRAMGDQDDLIRKDETIRKRNDVATAEELAALMRHAYTLSGSIAAQIASGEIVARPAQLDQWRACAWCEYHSVCGFDPALEGHETRRLEKLTKDEMMQRLDVEGNA